MKNQVCYSPGFPPAQCGHLSGIFSSSRRADTLTASRPQGRRHRDWLPGTILLLILCWTIGSLWLISVRQGERNREEEAERREIIKIIIQHKS